MKNIIIDDIYVVGVHHYSAKSLAVNDSFTLTPEPTNPYRQHITLTKDGQIYEHICKNHTAKLFVCVSQYANTCIDQN